MGYPSVQRATRYARQKQTRQESFSECWAPVITMLGSASSDHSRRHL